MARSDAEVVCQLPTWSAKKSKDFKGWLIVTCPHEDCGDFFLVRASRWLKAQRRVSRTKGTTFEIIGRSCPYCFRVAHLPTRSSIR